MYGHRLDFGLFSVEEKVRLPLVTLIKANVNFRSAKSSQIVQSPTTAVPKLLQLQRPVSMSTDVSSTAKENGLGSPRRSFDSSSGSIRSDSSIHPLKYTWVK